MPSVNKLLTALVAGLAIGAQASPCRPYVSPSSVIQSQLTTTEHVQSAARTSAAYTDTVRKSESESEATPYTTAVQVTSSTEAERKPTTTDEETAATTGYPVSESTSTADAESPSTAKGDTSSLPSTIEHSSAALYTTTSAPSTTSPEPKITLDTTTLAPTTTSRPTTTTQTATSTCPPKFKLTCNKTGSLNNGADYLIQILRDLDLASCKEECEKHDNCKAIGVTTAEQCELYSAAASTLGFETSDSWYSVFDACCFEDSETGN
ncbi:hypothetical protein F53441_2383 [Fusarium austroafricanum]|uniref:Apple domain-containing protein n=1 Tax=Fusarium austroafricanum TaxID=2364996 RepID=A0A8H4KU05_9HYPO|nr:hypothetical protein F53441_2383 [Fusarium austroafricanum]